MVRKNHKKVSICICDRVYKKHGIGIANILIISWIAVCFCLVGLLIKGQIRESDPSKDSDLHELVRRIRAHQITKWFKGSTGLIELHCIINLLWLKFLIMRTIGTNEISMLPFISNGWPQLLVGQAYVSAGRIIVKESPVKVHPRGFDFALSSCLLQDSRFHLNISLIVLFCLAN